MITKRDLVKCPDDVVSWIRAGTAPLGFMARYSFVPMVVLEYLSTSCVRTLGTRFRHRAMRTRRAHDDPARL